MLCGRGMREVAHSACWGRLQRFDVCWATGWVGTRARLGLADVAHLLTPGSLPFKRAALLLDVLQDVADLEWGLAQLEGGGEEGARQEEGGAGAAAAAHVGRTLGAQQLLLALQQRLELAQAAGAAGRISGAQSIIDEQRGISGGLVARVAGVLPDADVSLGVGWQQWLTEALLLRRQVQVLVERVRLGGGSCSMTARAASCGLCCACM